MGRTLRSRGHLTLLKSLKQARIGANLTQTELAERLARPQSYVAKYENGERKVEVVEFVQISAAIGCDPLKIIEAVAVADAAD
ncbi:MAG: helix-turn-helix transcriptional regulator [Litoreibacter sp.]